jgi:hypothetical protein
MKKLSAVMVVGLLCFAGAARADKTHASKSNFSSSGPSILLGVDVAAGLPLGTYGDANGIGGGPLVTAEYLIMPELSATLRAGFQYHFAKSPVAGVDSQIHSIPVLFGAKYYAMGTDRQGLFGAVELGLFGLMASASSGGTSASDTQMKFGVGGGIGYQWNEWNARLNIHAHDVGNFGDLLMVSGGVGYQFAGF